MAKARSRLIQLASDASGGRSTGTSSRERELGRHKGRHGLGSTLKGGEGGGLCGRRHSHRQAQPAREARDTKRP